jgi:hypothetical protein
MLKFSFQFVAVFVTVFLLGGYLSFWILMLMVALLSFYLMDGNGATFFATGLGFGLAWLVKAFEIILQTSSKLPAQMAELMGIQNENLLYLATFLIGFFIGGLSGLTGTLLKKTFQRRNSLVYRS